MRRHLLPLAILGLLTLVLADRAAELMRRHPGAELVASETRSATPDLKRRTSGSPGRRRGSSGPPCRAGSADPGGQFHVSRFADPEHRLCGTPLARPLGRADPGRDRRRRGAGLGPPDGWLCAHGARALGEPGNRSAVLARAG